MVEKNRKSTVVGQSADRTIHRIAASTLGDAIRAVAKAGKIRPDITKHGSLDNAYAHVEFWLKNAERIADWYDRKRRGRDHKAAVQQQFRGCLHAMAYDLDKLARGDVAAHMAKLSRCGGVAPSLVQQESSPDLRSLTELEVPDEHPLSRQSIEKSIHDIAALVNDFIRKADALGPRKGGRPANDWLLAFTWTMAQSWRDLTTLAVDGRGKFPSFAIGALAYMGKEWPDGLDWNSLIATCRRRFGDGLPGDDCNKQ